MGTVVLNADISEQLFCFVLWVVSCSCYMKDFPHRLANDFYLLDYYISFILSFL